MFGGFSQSAQVSPTTQVEVLTAIVQKIRVNISALNMESTCFLSATAFPSIDVNENLFCTVSPGNGQFDQGLMDGGGNVAMSEVSQVNVSVFSRIEADRLEHAVSQLTDPNRGLLVMKQLILSAIGGKNLDGGQYQGDSSFMLMEPLMPSHATHPPRTEGDFAGFTLTFEAKFNWNVGVGGQI